MSYAYRSKRQEWLGQALDDLQRRGVVVAWSMTFIFPPRMGGSSLAMWEIEVLDEPSVELETRPAEQLVQAQYDARQLRWMPVPPPGGKEAYAKMRRQLDGPD